MMTMARACMALWTIGFSFTQVGTPHAEPVKSVAESIYLKPLLDDLNTDQQSLPPGWGRYASFPMVAYFQYHENQVRLEATDFTSCTEWTSREVIEELSGQIEGLVEYKYGAKQVSLFQTKASMVELSQIFSQSPSYLVCSADSQRGDEATVIQMFQATQGNYWFLNEVSDGD